VPRRLSFLIDPQGNIAKTYRVKELAAHPDEVLEDLKTLQS
jgi:peroxiredoxin